MGLSEQLVIFANKVMKLWEERRELKQLKKRTSKNGKRKKKGRVSTDVVNGSGEAMSQCKAESTAEPSGEVQALRTLFEGVFWKEIGADPFDCRKNRCWALQLTFQLLLRSKDGEEISEILNTLVQLTNMKDMKRFSSDCLGLAPMVTAMLSLCRKIYEDDHKISNLSRERSKEICLHAVEVCCNLLWLYGIRSRKSRLWEDSIVAIASALILFRMTLSKCCDDWTENLSEHIRKFAWLVPEILHKEEIKNPEIQKEFRGFLYQLCRALTRLSSVSVDSWCGDLRQLCGALPPEDDYGHLFRTWKRITYISPKEGFAFLSKIIDSTLKRILEEADNMERSGDKDLNSYKMFEYIVGCLNEFQGQCLRWNGPKLANWWLTIHSLIISYSNQFEEKGDDLLKHHQEYLATMAEGIFSVSSRPLRHAEEKQPLRLDPNDSLLGVA
jgi:hypothetical protein